MTGALPPGAVEVPGEDGFSVVVRPIVVAVLPDGTRKIYHAEFLYINLAA